MISTSETIIQLNGTVLNYSGWSQKDDALQSLGPGALGESLVVQILATDAKRPLDVRYSFFMPRPPPVLAQTLPPMQRTPQPQWDTGPWLACSRTCDAGWQTRTVQCKDSQGRLAKSCPLEERPSAFKQCLIKKCWGLSRLATATSRHGPPRLKCIRIHPGLHPLVFFCFCIKSAIIITVTINQQCIIIWFLLYSCHHCVSELLTRAVKLSYHPSMHSLCLHTKGTSPGGKIMTGLDKSEGRNPDPAVRDWTTALQQRNQTLLQ